MDVVLHTSIRPEPFGRVLIEAMAVGRPVIAPREGGPLAIVADDETGVLVPPRDSIVLARAVVALVRDPARRAAMGHAGRRRAQGLFAIERHVAAVEAVFAALLPADAPARLHAAAFSPATSGACTSVGMAPTRIG